MSRYRTGQSQTRVGVFGSYGRGEAGVGSDLDLLLIDGEARGPQQRRLPLWPLADLPLSCDALVLTPSEHATLLASGSAMALALDRDSRWLWERGADAPRARRGHAIEAQAGGMVRLARPR